ncbi:MAG TPA: L,D-transpeptidase family protein [Gaiellaceae bacterium]|nr:L,D-transpeptidase family protein [Gaiellaceae bacterium]
MRWVALSGLVVLAIAAAGASPSGGQSASGCPATLANQLASTGQATQLITVVTAGYRSTHGTLRLWRKAGNGCWRPVTGPWWAWVGGRGVSDHKREGDRTTPTGAYGFGRVMYGTAPNPGVHYPYHRVVCGDWWVEDPASPSYNRFRHVPCGSTPPFRTTSEDLSRSPTAYRHFAVIAYNSNPIVPGRGSGIFLHVSTGRPTLGCVSLSLPRLVTTLRWLRPSPSPLIVIGTAAEVRQF